MDADVVHGHEVHDLRNRPVLAGVGHLPAPGLAQLARRLVGPAVSPDVGVAHLQQDGDGAVAGAVDLGVDQGGVVVVTEPDDLMREGDRVHVAVPYRHLLEGSSVKDLNTRTISVCSSGGISSDHVASPISITRGPGVDGEWASRIRSELDGAVVVVEESGDAELGVIALLEFGEREDVVAGAQEGLVGRTGVLLVKLVLVAETEVLDGVASPGQLSERQLVLGGQLTLVLEQVLVLQRRVGDIVFGLVEPGEEQRDEVRFLVDGPEPLLVKPVPHSVGGRFEDHDRPVLVGDALVQPDEQALRLLPEGALRAVDGMVGEAAPRAGVAGRGDRHRGAGLEPAQ